jgi:hypothetical protein
MKKVTDCLINKAYKDIRNAYNSICGSFTVEKPKRWVIDTDGYTPEKIQMMKTLIAELGGIVIESIPTINGMHLITNPFNTQESGKMWMKDSTMNIPDIQKNNPTLLYYSDEGVDSLKDYNGIYDDDGNKINILDIPVPDLCLTCESFLDDDWEENVLCNLTRADKREEGEEFKCYSWRKKET